MHDDFSVECVTTLERARELEGDLWQLFARDPCATPFQAPAWWLSWAEQFAPAGALRLLLARQGTRCVAAVPLTVAQQGGERVLRWLGHGITDRLDAIVDPDAGEAPFARLVAELEGLWRAVERVELEELPSASPQLPLWRALGARLTPGSICPVLALDASGADLRQRLARSLSRNLSQTERRLANFGKLRWEMAEGARSLDLLEAFIQLHSMRWRARGEPGVLAHPSVQAFHRAAAPSLIERGLLQLEVLYADARPLAATYVLRRRDAHLYLFGFDSSATRLSLGSLAIWRSIERAARDGLRRYDFLRGQERYKYAFGARDEVALSARSVQAAAAEKPPESWPRTRSA
jgi:CelD/BcsL family acetyltransferase involved in cellulose biosynthesis